MEIDNGKNSRPYLVVGCSYHCFPFVHQMFCEPGVIGKGGEVKTHYFLTPICKTSANICKIIFSPNLQPICYSLPLLMIQL